MTIITGPQPNQAPRTNTTNYWHPQETNLLNLHKALTYNFEGKPIIRTTDSSGDYTSKNRIKISPYETQFFNTFQFGKETDVWDEAVTSGGSAVHDATVSGVIMEVDSTIGAQVIRQTRNVMRYIPGRSSELSFAVRLETPVQGVRRRFGLFDENNGFYFDD
jgi:hypothetical protein